MKHILLNKAFALGAITLALASCGESDGNQQLYPEGLAAPTFSGDMVIEISENQEPLTIDLLGDVNNPEDSALFARKLTYLRVELDEDGLPVNVDAEGNVVAAGTGQEVPLWEGPTLPSGTVVQTSNSITIDVSELRPFLVPQHTLDTYPNPVVVGQPDGVDNEENNDFDRYLQGVYRYTYIIDNGSADPVERNIILKVNADTVDAESINLVTDSNIEVPKGYGVNIVATVEPSAFYGAGATFANVIYTSLNPEIATVNELGLVTGVEFGTFEIKLTSQDGLVETIVTGEVVPLTEPVGVVIVADNEVPQQQIFDRYQVALDGTLDIDHTFLPAEVDFPDATVTWSSMDESKVMVDGDGLLMPVAYNNDFDREDDASMVNVTEVMVAVEDNPSLNFSVEVEIVPERRFICFR
ncbi:Ig-like domain-containing protein [Paraglaciecola aquimarina]|uniref:Ig-like domain-containing protein n=1 Tax=Paraglaciecola aquimarina TaxID=1235557 RepID=A0ABU3SYM7_9ALTE|nr:Ig-like domain-containing protein [Paraglaciecola aquimarina]MDU0355114.1 Ig-like domain-containing protein [Paraglaciecola aquimarina]